MSTPAAHLNLPPNAQPIGTRTPVMPTAPGQPMLPGTYAGQGAPTQAQGPAYVQGLGPAGQVPEGVPTGRPDLSRPEILDQIVQRQNESADPQRMAEIANQQRLEQMILESNQRSQQQAEQLGQAVTMLTETQRQNAEYQQQQLQLQQQQIAAQQAAQQANQRMPWEDPSLQLDSQTEQVFEESLPVINTVSRRNALQAAHEMVQQTVTPEVQALQQKLQALETRMASQTQLQAQSFRDQLQDTADSFGLDLNILQDQPDWIQFQNEVTNPYKGTTVGADVSAALQGASASDLRVLRQIFKSFVERRNSDQQGGTNELPPPVGNARPNSVQQTPPGQEQIPDPMAAVGQQAQQLEQYRSQLLDSLRRGQIEPSKFQSEIAQIESSMDALISQTQH